MRVFDKPFELLPVDHPSRMAIPMMGTSLNQEQSHPGVNDTLPVNDVNPFGVPAVAGFPGAGSGRGRDKYEQIAADSVANQGYARVTAEFQGELSRGDLGLARAAFLATVRDNPLDRYSAGNRHRRFQVFYFHPWTDRLESRPPVWDAERKEWVSTYIQAATINPEQGGKPRAFAPFSAMQRFNPFLGALIKKCYRGLPWEATDSLIVGAHVIQLVARPGMPAASSPDYLHCDSEPYTWAFLLERCRVDGGENLIAVPKVANQHPSTVADSDILERFTLEQPFDGWVVNDKLVSHYVSPVSVAENETVGWRTILLIDFSRAIPDVAH